MSRTICLSKLNERLAANYHEWIPENGISESVETLHTWIMRHVEFRDIAMEDVNRLQIRSPVRGDRGIENIKDDHTYQIRQVEHTRTFKRQETICAL